MSEIRQEPYSLPGGFYWDTLDLSNQAIVSNKNNRNFYLRKNSGGAQRYESCSAFHDSEIFTKIVFKVNITDF